MLGDTTFVVYYLPAIVALVRSIINNSNEVFFPPFSWKFCSRNLSCGIPCKFFCGYILFYFSIIIKKSNTLIWIFRECCLSDFNKFSLSPDFS